MDKRLIIQEQKIDKILEEHQKERQLRKGLDQGMIKCEDKLKFYDDVLQFLFQSFMELMKSEKLFLPGALDSNRVF